MNTPICDFVRAYAESGALRLHMPGHKGYGVLGVEHLDLTEIDGADDLYHPSGIIAESEANASALFGCRTLYSTEGSSQCIRAMVMLLYRYALQTGRHPRIAAARNVHKTFLSAAALTGTDVSWLFPKHDSSYLSCRLSADDVAAALDETEEKPVAVYITSPDYLGNLADVAGIADVCHQRGVLLAVDNAHGAYLRFLPESMHPMDLGADICCDSAHKTLPVITGGAYLHLADHLPDFFASEGKSAMAMFGSTSPSYLILQSLDGANQGLARDFPERLKSFLPFVQASQLRLSCAGWCFSGEEPMKLTIDARASGYTGTELADLLARHQIFCEFADPDFLVLMVTPDTGRQGLARLENVLLGIPRRNPLPRQAAFCCRPEQVMSIRDAAFAPSETIPAGESLGRILSAATVSCPPAVPIVCCGERIDKNALACFAQYGIETCVVVK